MLYFLSAELCVISCLATYVIQIIQNTIIVVVVVVFVVMFFIESLFSKEINKHKKNKKL